MANIVITSLHSNIRIDFNDLSAKYAVESLMRQKSDFSLTRLASGVVVNITGLFKMTVYHDQLSIVDSINGLVPTSNVDLYNKLCDVLISLEDLITLLIEASPTITYVGKARAGSNTADPVWRISRLDTTADTIVLFADGDSSFNKILDNAATYTYS